VVGIDPEVFAKLDACCFVRGWPASSFTVDPLHWGAYVKVKGVAVAYLFANLVAGESELHRIGCVPGCRGQGLAKQLMRAYLDQAPASSFYLEVSHSNQSAIQLYRHFGYRQVGERRNYYGTGDHALLLSRDGSDEQNQALLPS
jgi:ribosomal-protein-alanine N-acetyltransferase